MYGFGLPKGYLIRESVWRLFKDSKGFKSATNSKLRQHRMRGHIDIGRRFSSINSRTPDVISHEN